MSEQNHNQNVENVENAESIDNKYNKANVFSKVVCSNPVICHQFLQMFKPIMQTQSFGNFLVKLDSDPLLSVFSFNNVICAFADGVRELNRQASQPVNNNILNVENNISSSHAITDHFLHSINDLNFITKMANQFSQTSVPDDVKVLLMDKFIDDLIVFSSSSSSSLSEEMKTNLRDISKFIDSAMSSVPEETRTNVTNYCKSISKYFVHPRILTYVPTSSNSIFHRLNICNLQK